MSANWVSLKNRCETLVTMRMEDWFKLYHEWEAGREED